MKVGDLVTYTGGNQNPPYEAAGLVVAEDSGGDIFIPPRYVVLWDTGEMNKIYLDELEVIDETG